MKHTIKIVKNNYGGCDLEIRKNGWSALVINSPPNQPDGSVDLTGYAVVEIPGVDIVGIGSPVRILLTLAGLLGYSDDISDPIFASALAMTRPQRQAEAA